MDQGDPVNNSKLECDVHIGTHIDAPWHFVPKGKTIEQLSLNKLIGEAFVINMTGLSEISKESLERLNIPSGVKKLLIRTDNSEHWRKKKPYFNKKYVALTADAASWIVENGIELVGIDYLSIQRYEDPPLTHEILLKAETVIVEGLNLSEVDPGIYEFICLPIKLVGADGAPARAVLRKKN